MSKPVGPAVPMWPAPRRLGGRIARTKEEQHVEIVVKSREELRWDPPTDRSTERIADLAEVRRYIHGLDFGQLRDRLADSPERLGRGWSADQCSYYEGLYKNWLYLRRRYEGEILPPQVEIDEFWHGHILDTRTYFRDCDLVGNSLALDLGVHSLVPDGRSHGGKVPRPR